ncbi:hypothetical protein QOZ80_2AG0146010 [Eleusine coracana subsp. coracana]|nr:hypothetical protein QOZ80_2AG0146010 [Eleusine coracana subsp. coracana]
MSSASGANIGHGKEEALYKEQLSKIGKVRAALGQLSGKSALYCSDASIARYLIARNWDVKKATKMLKKTLKWRSEYKPDEIRWDDISNEALTGKIYRTDYFDKSGRSILVMRPGCQNTKNANGQVKYLVYCMENAILNLPPDVLQGHYPERLGIAILYNAPKFFESFWKVASPLLEKKTFNKVRFVYSDRPDTMKIIDDLFNMDELEAAFGGKNPTTFNINDYAVRMREDDKKMPLFWSPENSDRASEPYLMTYYKPQENSSGLKNRETESGKQDNTEETSEKMEETETESEKREESDTESEKSGETKTESSAVESTSLPGKDTAQVAQVDKSVIGPDL